MKQKYNALEGHELVVGGRYVWVCVARNGLLFVHDITIVTDADGHGKCGFYNTADDNDYEIMVPYQVLGLTYGGRLEDGNFNRLYRFEEALYADFTQLAREHDLVDWLRYLSVADPETVAARLCGTVITTTQPSQVKPPYLRLVIR